MASDDCSTDNLKIGFHREMIDDDQQTIRFITEGRITDERN